VLLGSGAFSTVWQTIATKAKTAIPVGTDVAIKEFHDGSSRDSQYFKQASDKESQQFLALNQRDEFVKLLETLKDEASGVCCLVFEHCAGGSLASVLAADDLKLSNDDVHKGALRLLRGLQHLRSFRLVHRDIAPRNVFLRKPGDFSSLVIGDVGCSEVADSKDWQPRGVSSHLAPECVGEDPIFSFASDLFSAGCILLAMLVGVSIKESARDSAFWINAMQDSKFRF
jgi:serine/threonine protein kinase